jgi:serine protease Do
MRRLASVAAVVSMVSATALAMASVRARAAGEEGKDERRHVEVIRIGGGGARLGVVLEDVRPDDVSRLKLAEERGARVEEVAKGSAAEKAGLQEGDVILSYQGERVGSAAQLRRLVRETPPGRRVAIEASRAGAVQRLTASLEETRDEQGPSELEDSFHFDVPVPPVPPMPPMPPLGPMFEDGDHGRRFLFRNRFVEGRPGRLGLTYQELSGQLARYFQVDDGALLVTDVEEDGPAAQAGVRAGDVIVKFNGKAVTDGDVLRRTLGEAPAGGDVTLTVHRDGRPMDLKVTPRGDKRLHAPKPTA